MDLIGVGDGLAVWDVVASGMLRGQVKPDAAQLVTRTCVTISFERTECGKTIPVFVPAPADRPRADAGAQGAAK